MITQYNTPIQNPYVPKPWDHMFRTEQLRQSLQTGLEQQRQQYLTHTDAITQQMDENKFNREMKKYEEAEANLEQANAILSSVYPSNPEDEAQLNEIRRGYMDMINKGMEGAMDNPYKYNALIRSVKMHATANVMSGPLSRIMRNTKRAEEMQQRQDDFNWKMKAFNATHARYDEDYRKVAINAGHHIGDTPDIMKYETQIVNSMDPKSPLRKDVDALTQHVYNDIMLNFEKDFNIRQAAGRSPDEIKLYYLSIARQIAEREMQVSNPGGSTSSGNTAGRGAQNYSRIINDPKYGEYRYVYENFASEKERNEAENFAKANLVNLSFIDPSSKRMKVVTGAEILAASKDGKMPDIVLGGQIQAGTHQFEEYGGDVFIQPLDVLIGGKPYVMQQLPSGGPPTPEGEVYLNEEDRYNKDMNSINQAKSKHSVTFRSAYTGQQVRVSHTGLGYTMTLPDGTMIQPEQGEGNEEARLMSAYKKYISE